MNDKTRDEMIMETHDVIIRLAPMVQSHDTVLFGNGQGGLKENVALLTQREEHCPARLAHGAEGKKMVIAYTMMVLAIISLVASTIISLVIIYHNRV